MASELLLRVPIEEDVTPRQSLAGEVCCDPRQTLAGTAWARCSDSGPRAIPLCNLSGEMASQFCTRSHVEWKISSGNNVVHDASTTILRIRSCTYNSMLFFAHARICHRLPWNYDSDKNIYKSPVRRLGDQSEGGDKHYHLLDNASPCLFQELEVAKGWQRASPPIPHCPLAFAELLKEIT